MSPPHVCHRQWTAPELKGAYTIPRRCWESGLWITAVHSYHFSLQNCAENNHHRQFKILLGLNKVIRTAKAIESKIKIRSIPVEHLRFMGIHDAAHANLEGGASQQGHLFLAVHASITNCRVLVSVLTWQSKKIKRGSMSTCQEHIDSMRTMWEPMIRSDSVLENYEQFLTARPSILSPTAKAFTMQYTRKQQLQRQQTRDWQLSWQ